MNELIPTTIRDKFEHLREGVNQGMERWLDRGRSMIRKDEDLMPEAFASGTLPKIDVEDLDDEVLVTAELPGLDKKDFAVELDERRLTIRGEKKASRERKEGGYHYSESSYGSFCRTIPLPWKIESDKVQAKYRNGELKIHLPKTEEEKARRVHVKVNVN